MTETIPTSLTLGSARITRIPEFVLDVMAPERLFPGLDPASLSDAERKLMTGAKPDSNTVPLPVHPWLVEWDGRVILIDTGAGNGKSRPFSKFFENLDNPFLERLALAGIRPEDVDCVLLTHLHVDHIGWNTRLEGAAWVPTFPRARYVFPATEMAFFETEAGRPRRALLEDSILPIIAAGQGETIPPEGGTVEGLFSFAPAPGHTAGQMTISLTSEGQEALFCADALHNPIQVGRPDLSSVFCVDPATAVTTRRRLLDYAADRPVTLLPSHFPGSGAGRVARGAEGFIWQPV
ncbi:MBL fold metallo-hydrolase [Acidisoma silvae]|uniref:MBL fold metallo-hydrolase n=1 Tax=Acidisoma silvae TaxID=2802396 RepID=A0A964DZH8_9PROT|nr:MBL fold metallo-hydrolase [Acidisoma silvae]MCB8876301.1 MBL fold metallo-hydrolase [Acidisoma silvae]